MLRMRSANELSDLGVDFWQKVDRGEDWTEIKSRWLKTLVSINIISQEYLSAAAGVLKLCLRYGDLWIYGKHETRM